MVCFVFYFENKSNFLGTSGGSDDQQTAGVQPLTASTSSSATQPSSSIANGFSKKKKSHRRLGSGVKNHDEGIDLDIKQWSLKIAYRLKDFRKSITNWSYAVLEAEIVLF